MSFKDKSTLELIALRADIDAAIAVIEREKALRASAKAKQATKPKPPRTPKPKRAPEQNTPERPKRLTLKPRADVDATAKPDSANQTVAALETLEPAAETPHATMQPVQPALDSTHAPVKFMHPANRTMVWDGVGEQPVWLKVYLDRGGSWGALETTAEIFNSRRKRPF